jgi:hypothetical protein
MILSRQLGCLLSKRTNGVLSGCSRVPCNRFQGSFVRFDEELSEAREPPRLSIVNKGKSRRQMYNRERSRERTSYIPKEVVPAAKLYLKSRKIGAGEYYQTVYDSIMGEPTINMNERQEGISERSGTQNIESLDQLFQLMVGHRFTIL